MFFWNNPPMGGLLYFSYDKLIQNKIFSVWKEELLEYWMKSVTYVGELSVTYVTDRTISFFLCGLGGEISPAITNNCLRICFEISF